MKKLYTEESVIEIANAIRSKTDSVETMSISQMADKILSIETSEARYLEADDDGKSQVEIVIDEYDTKDFTIVAGGNTTAAQIAVDFGDGSDIQTGTVYAAGNLPFNHTYASAGRYIVKMWSPNWKPYRLGYYSSSYRNLTGEQPNKANEKSYKTPMVRRIRTGTNCRLGNFAAYFMPNLVSVYVEDGQTDVGDRCFSNSQVKYVRLPDTITAIQGYMWYADYNATYIKIPRDVTTVYNWAFAYTTSCREYDFSDCTSVPVLNNSNAFDVVKTITDGSRKIVVSDELYDDWIADTNWAALSALIFKKSEA